MVRELQQIARPHERELPELGAPLPAGTVIVSTDSHLMEAEHLWEDRLPARFKDRAPKLWRDEQGWHLEIDGTSLDLPAGSLLAEGRPGIYDVKQRIKDLDAEGVDKELLFPQRGLSVIKIADQELRHACFRVYNEYLSEYCSNYPQRFYGIGVLNWWQPEAARDNIQELQALGFPAMEIPSAPPDVSYNSPALEPLWSAIEDSGIPLSFHIGESFQVQGPGALGTLLLVNFQPFRRLFGLLTFAGVFDRHPGLRVVFTEGGISWVPSALFDADRLYRDFESVLDPKLTYPPSHYWFQNCYATFQEDPLGLQLLDEIGYDKVLWASDYPHPESTLGYTRRSVWDVFNATTVEKAQAIVGGTAVKLWGLN